MTRYIKLPEHDIMLIDVVGPCLNFAFQIAPLSQLKAKTFVAQP